MEDQLGHAINTLDPIESLLLNEAEKFSNVFRSLMLKNEVIKGYLRFIHAGFPGQRELAKESAEAVYGFSKLVERVVDLYKNDKVFNRATLRFLQHHFPESCYFLRKLYNYTPGLFQEPDCQLTTYRI
ncbi:DUF2935 domain-containing protein [Pseudalkalibacillus sp. A8]|uniref:DUF2935 domain-containing protein n=1 Tax=Pseudalkalibacillus sp. A8 TaxID=3382641 RepID=UPI0038B624FB